METAPDIDGETLRAARIRAGLTQHQLAVQLDLGGGARVSMWERGASRPRSPELLHDLAAALDVQPAALLVAPEGAPSLRWLRYVAGVSVEDVAHAAHVSVAAVKRWEAGTLRRTPAQPTIEAVAALLAVDADVVLAALRP